MLIREFTTEDNVIIQISIPPSSEHREARKDDGKNEVKWTKAITHLVASTTPPIVNAFKKMSDEVKYTEVEVEYNVGISLKGELAIVSGQLQTVIKVKAKISV